jgi:hypothetical protein
MTTGNDECLFTEATTTTVSKKETLGESKLSEAVALPKSYRQLNEDDLSEFLMHSLFTTLNSLDVPQERLIGLHHPSSPVLCSVYPPLFNYLQIKDNISTTRIFRGPWP